MPVVQCWEATLSSSVEKSWDTLYLSTTWGPRSSAAHQLPLAKGKRIAHFSQCEERQKSILLPTTRSSSCAAALHVAVNQIVSTKTCCFLFRQQQHPLCHVRAHRLIMGKLLPPLQVIATLLPGLRGLAHLTGHTHSTELQ